MARKTLKNHKVEAIASNLCSIEFVSNFIGVSKNSIYLRIHFNNFVRPIKINGKLYFDMSDILEYIQKDSQEEAFCYLVRDEIRTMIDLDIIDREYLGRLLNSTKPQVTGGNIYLRPIGYKRAKILKDLLESSGKKFEITDEIYSIQKTNRLKYIYQIWEIISENNIENILSYINPKHKHRVLKSILSQGPSYKIAKLIHLYIIKYKPNIIRV